MFPEDETPASEEASEEAAPPAEAVEDAVPTAAPPERGDPDPQDQGEPEIDDYAPPFETRSFGGEFVWANTPTYTAKILRVRPGENVVVSTQGRRDMFAMLTGGRGILEVRSGDTTDRVELLPASPIPILPDNAYRLIAMTEVELYTIYSPL